MDNSTYLALSKQVTSFNKLNVTANNVANANTAGFKKEQMVFDQFLTKDVKEKVAFPNDVTTTIDRSDGPLTPTGRALDISIVGDGFFMVKTPNGIRYTRNGNFHVNSESTLVDVKGNPVLSGDNQEIVFEEGDGAPVIAQNGTITVNGDDRGSIGVVEFANPHLLRKSPEGMMMSEVLHLVKEDPKIVQGMLEGSNVNSIEEMVKLTEIQKDAATTSGLINNFYDMQRNAYKVYSGTGG